MAAATIREFSRILRQMSAWLDKADAHAAAKSFDVENLASARLAPDAFNLVRQVQSACDAAKFAAAYTAGMPAPAHPDTEKTIAEVRPRLLAVAAWLDGFTDADFEGAATRKVSPGWARGKHIGGEGYLTEIAVPNFFFHATMTYAILRHNGVPLGKNDFMGPVSLQD